MVYNANSFARVSLAALVIAMGGSASAQEIVLGYVPASLAYPFNVATAQGFEDEAKELGARAVVLNPRGSVETQGNAIDDLVAQGAQGVAVLPLDGVVAQTWADRLTEMNIPIVAVATPVGNADQVLAPDFVYANLNALVSKDNVHAGELAAELAATLLPRDRIVKIGIIEGAAGYPQVVQRSEGFEKGLDAAGIQYQIVASQPTDWTPEEGEAVCQNMLTSNPDMDLIFSQADDMALGCARALTALDAQTRLVATGGGSELGVQAIVEGDLDGSVCDNPELLGRLAAKALFEAVKNQNTVKGQRITYETPIITSDNLKDCQKTW